jgi:catechol 2,3-dioxygenase-like lactoylglutathione lyase family enzyme
MNLFLACLAVVLCVIPASAAVAQRPAITGLAYVRVATNDMVASQKFYADRLQLPEVPCAIRDCKQYQVNKDQYVQVVKANGEVNGMNLVAFQTSDVEKLRKYLAAHDVKVPKVVGKNSDGSRGFEVIDPEGHRVAFVQAGKRSDKSGAISHRLMHVGFVVKDRATEDRFFKDVLGFRPYWYGGRNDDHPLWVSQQVPNGSDWLEYMLDIPADASHHTLGVHNHLSLGIGNIDDAAAGLAKSGWKPNDLEHVQLGRDGKRQLNVYDPDDVRVEFMEFKPTGKTCCSEFTAKHPEAD